MSTTTAQKTAWKRRNRDKVYAHKAVAYALRTGRLVRAEACQECGTVCRTEARHEDYTRRLDVTWLCAGYHAERHPERGRKAAAAA